MELNELDVVSVESVGEGYWDVYTPLYLGSDRAEYWDTVTAAELAAAQRQGLEVYDRRTGRAYDVD